MRDIIAPDRQVIIALCLVALAATYSLYRLYDFGVNARTRTLDALAVEINARHAAVCDRLGRAESSPERASCLLELDDLKRWHEEILARQSASLL